jgi:hypothetical protein
VGATDEEDPPVLESEFRYPGPKPDSKETGILMLADSVEAASRSLDSPSHKNLKSLIDLIFQERIEDGQLDETDLTFQDLRIIKETFLKMLLGIYHVRVKYPDQEVEESEETGPTVVAVEGETPYEDVTVDVEEGPWGIDLESPDTEALDAVPGLRDPREPRPELAQASPHYRAEREKGTEQKMPPDVPEAASRDERTDEPSLSVSEQDPSSESDAASPDESSEDEKEASPDSKE